MKDTVKIQILEDIPSFATVYENRIVKIPALKKGDEVVLPTKTAVAFIIKHRAMRVD